jgi:hypothetical protein
LDDTVHRGTMTKGWSEWGSLPENTITKLKKKKKKKKEFTFV